MLGGVLRLREHHKLATELPRRLSSRRFAIVQDKVGLVNQLGFCWFFSSSGSSRTGSNARA